MNFQPEFQFLRGFVEENPTYTPLRIKKYQGKMLIEALPKIWTVDEFLNDVTFTVEHDPEKERQLEVDERIHITTNAFEFYTPMSRDIKLQRKLSRLLRHGYIGRDPLSVHWRETTDKIKKVIDKSIKKPEELDLRQLQQTIASLRSSSRVITLLGVGGIGKTTALNHIISLYPQIINHSEYNNQKIQHRQLVWLKIDCPHDGSIRQMCLSFLYIVDSLLKTSYFKIYGKNGRATKIGAALGMAVVVAQHSLGVLIIDEFQNLLDARGGEDKQLINFLVNIINLLNVPMIFTGTPKAGQLLIQDFRIARRMAGDGELNWTRYKEDDPDWIRLINSMWKYQYTKYYVPLTPEMQKTIYYVSQGVIDIAVKVFVAAQDRAIENGNELFTTVTIESVMRDEMTRVNSVLDLVRAGNEAALEILGDIDLIDMATLFKNAQDDIIQRQMAAKLRTEKKIKNTKGKRRARRRKDADYSPASLMGIVLSNKKSGINGYEALDKVGYIKSPGEFWLEGNYPWT